DAPGIGLLVEDGADLAVELVTLGQHLVQVVLAEHRAQRGLGELAGGFVVALDVDDRFLRIDHAEIHHRVDLHRHVVARDQVLRRDVHDDGAHVHPLHGLQHRDQEDQARPLDLPEPAELEHHRALVFAQDLDGTEDRQRDRDQDRQGKHGEVHWLASGVWLMVSGDWPGSGSTRSSSPSRDSTRTRWPACSGRSDSACQSSPRMRTCARSPSTRATTASRPGISSAPPPTGLRRARSASQMANVNNPALVMPMPAISQLDTPKPGTSSNSITDPNTSATSPPIPSTPNVGVVSSTTINMIPSTISARPA